MNDRRELSFDSVADEYEQTRPTYPAALLDALPLDADASVLDHRRRHGQVDARPRRAGTEA